MKFFNHKEDKKINSSYLLIFFCLLFVLLDLYTTYLASPDLKLEGNWFVRYFGLKWPQIIIFYLLDLIILSIWLLIGMNMINKYYKTHITETSRSFIGELLRSRKLIFGLFLIGSFYSQIIASAFATVNNYLSYIYLFKKVNLFSEISTAYINFEIASGNLFFPISKVIIITGASIYSVFIIRRIGIKTRITQQSDRISEPVEINAEFVS